LFHGFLQRKKTVKLRGVTINTTPHQSVLCIGMRSCDWPITEHEILWFAHH